VIWFQGSQRVLIYSTTATSDGRIIAAGKAEKADGEAAPFVALTDLAGKVTTVIQTKGFAPMNICQAPDGTVWSFGGTGYDEHSEPNPGDTLRHFDFQKGEIGS
jgi:streptogramin lyase